MRASPFLCLCLSTSSGISGVRAFSALFCLLNWRRQQLKRAMAPSCSAVLLAMRAVRSFIHSFISTTINPPPPNTHTHTR